MLHVSELGYSLLFDSVLVWKGFQVSLNVLKASVLLDNAVVAVGTLKNKSYHLDTCKLYNTALISNETCHERFEHVEYSTIVSMSDGTVKDWVFQSEAITSQQYRNSTPENDRM